MKTSAEYRNRAEHRNEAERLKSLRKLNIFDTPAEDRFDRITRLCTNVFDVPYAAINFIDSNRQWTKSCAGIDVPVCPREDSICARTMLDSGVTVITDAREDDRLRDLPSVIGDPHVRFYMSHPIRSPVGLPYGTLCIYDSKPRMHPGKKACEMLKEFASMTEGELHRVLADSQYNKLFTELEKAERRSRIDPLTRLWNRRGILELLQKEISRARRENEPLSVAMADIDNFKEINDTFGHPVGDAVLKEVARRMRRATRDYDQVSRYGGEEFLIVMVNTDRPVAKKIAERIRLFIGEKPVTTREAEMDVTVSIGIEFFHASGDWDLEELIRRADENLYRAKNAGKNQTR